MNRAKDKKTVMILLAVVAVIVLAYVAQDLYFGYTGPIQTSVLLLSSEDQNVTVQGFAVRDEARYKNGKNISVLQMDSDKVCIPIVSDSASVAVGDSIAVCFAAQTQAELYDRIQTLEKKIDELEQLQNLENPTLINASALNADISSALNAYLAAAESGDYDSLAAAQRTLNAKITIKQLAAGGDLNVSARIEKYAAKKAQLERKIKSKTYVTSPYAGYFVSRVDGYEDACSYEALENGEISTEQIQTLLEKSPAETPKAFGKIIGQHTWYFVCNMTLTDASVLKKGKTVTVDFPKENLFDLPMKVHAVSARSGDEVAVVFQCTRMNEQISNLRMHSAEITVQTYEGYRINHDLLVKNEEGLTGVYVLAGKRVVFKPVRILYETEGFAVVTPAVYYLENGEVDTEKTPNLPQLENYDQIIVKGRNLYDGKVLR